MLKEITGYKMVTGKRQDSKASKNCKGFFKKFKRSELLETLRNTKDLKANLQHSKITKAIQF